MESRGLLQIPDRDCSTKAPPMAANEKIALVTGSASGIGAQIAIGLANDGYLVIVTGRDDNKMQRVVAACNRVPQVGDGGGSTSCHSIRAVAYKADLLDLKQLDELIEFVRVTFGRLDLLINNACWRGAFKQPIECDRASYDDFKQVMRLNVSVPTYLIHKCLIPLARINYQTRHHDVEPRVSDDLLPIVINISSIAGYIVVPLHSYSISKACLTELTRQLTSHDVQEQTGGLLSVTISPGPILTDELPHHASMSDMTILNRVGTTKEVADLVMFAVKNAHLFHGRELTIDGGYATKQRAPTTSPPTC